MLLDYASVSKLVNQYIITNPTHPQIQTQHHSSTHKSKVHDTGEYKELWSINNYGDGVDTPDPKRR